MGDYLEQRFSALMEHWKEHLSASLMEDPIQTLRRPLLEACLPLLSPPRLPDT
jgi:hypothetical protein